MFYEMIKNEEGFNVLSTLSKMNARKMNGDYVLDGNNIIVPDFL